jgi:thiol-disulfide isomerase/thioredoxin
VKRIFNVRRLLGATLGIALAVAFMLAMGPPRTTTGAEEKAGDPKAKAEKSDEEAFKVPDGTPEELVNFIKKMFSQQPPADPEAAKKMGLKIGRAALEAGDKILAAKPKPTADQAQMAVQAKVNGYQILDRFGEKDAAEKLQALPEELKKAGWAELARGVERVLLRRKMMGAGEDRAAYDKGLAEVKKFFAAQKLEAGDIRLAFDAAQAAEGFGDERAAAVFRDLGALFAKAEDKQVAAFGVKFNGAANRLSLKGKPMEVAGEKLQGKPLEWDKYRGKVVLVDFWATWCGPCRAEIPNMLKAYEGYSSKGFDVVAISLDDDREDLEKFVKDNKIPWTVLYDHAAEKGDKDDSMSGKYGVFAIPEMMLVDKEGKVLARGVRGKALDEQLEKLLGPPEKKPEAKAAEKKTEEKKAEEKK